MGAVSFIGSGNMAFCLASHMYRQGITIAGVYSKTPAHASEFAKQFNTHNFNSAQEAAGAADMVIIAIKDDEIEPLAKTIQTTHLVVHTSGMTPMSVLTHLPRHGVWYPLQSISRSAIPDASSIPIGIEAGSTSDLGLLRDIGIQCGFPVFEIDSERRAYLHLAAVFVNNFTNHLHEIASILLKEKGLSGDLLQPLIDGTAAKLQHMDPHQAQTGPALRNDRLTMLKHLELLKSHPEWVDLYEQISGGIIRLHSESN